MLGSTRFTDGCPLSVLSTGSTRSLSSQSKYELHAPASYRGILGEALIMIHCQYESGFKQEEKPRQRQFRTGSEPVSLRPFKRDCTLKKQVTVSENSGDLHARESLATWGFTRHVQLVFLCTAGRCPCFLPPSRILVRLDDGLDLTFGTQSSFWVMTSATG